MFSCEFRKIFKNTCFTEHLWVAASAHCSWRLAPQASITICSWNQFNCSQRQRTQNLIFLLEVGIPLRNTWIVFNFQRNFLHRLFKIYVHKNVYNFWSDSLMSNSWSNLQKQPPVVLCKKDVLRNFTKFTRKRLCLILFFNKVAGLWPELFKELSPWTQYIKWTYVTSHVRTRSSEDVLSKFIFLKNLQSAFS